MFHADVSRETLAKTTLGALRSGARVNLEPSLRAGDLLLTVAGKPVAVAQDLQRLMFSDAIGRPLSITVMRNGALVDVIAEPSELVAA